MGPGVLFNWSCNYVTAILFYYSHDHDEENVLTESQVLLLPYKNKDGVVHNGNGVLLAMLPMS